jgi:hypothetical protein
MGTRADFYIKSGENLVAEDWIGSIAWDGYPDAIDAPILKAKSADGFRTAVDFFFAHRDDVTLPKEGWPWPWDDSGTTDYAYVFDKDAVRIHGCEEEFWPDMTAIKNVQLGPKKSGIMIFKSK